MPTYQYKCEPCRVIYRVAHGMDEAPEVRCPECGEPTSRMVSAPMLSTRGFNSPTQARYAHMSKTEEIAREGELQKVYRTVWMPNKIIKR